MRQVGPRVRSSRPRAWKEAISENGKVVVNLTTGHEDSDRLPVAFLVATATAQSAGRAVVMFP